MIPFLAKLVIKYLHVVYVRTCDIYSYSRAKHARISLNFKINQISYYKANIYGGPGGTFVSF